MSRFATSTTRRAAVAAVALASAAGLSAVLPASAHDTGESSGHGSHGGHGSEGSVHGRTLFFASPLSDLATATEEPLEGASATLRMTLGEERSAFVLKIEDIDRSADGKDYGAHLHSGPCVPGDGAAAGPHYNSANPPIVDEDHEVWLDFTVSSRGTGKAVAVVPFVPKHGARSVVVHEMATNPDTGAAGGRLACFPVVW